MTNLKRFWIILVLAGLFTACSGETVGGEGVYVWIDVPLDGLNVPSGQPVQVEGHASHPGGISKVEVFVNGQHLDTLPDPVMTGSLSSFTYLYTPPQPGDYTIQVVAYSVEDVASQPDSARIRVGEEPEEVVVPETVVTDTPTLVSFLTFTPTEELTETPTPPPAPQPVVQFWAEPAEIDAGDCALIYWHVENIDNVVYGGVSQPFNGLDQACLCETAYYPLTVTYLDGTSEKFTLEIPVKGSCPTEVPEDTTPPPVPTLVVPADGLTIGCKATQNLVWLPVEDPGGISAYRIRVQRHAGDNNWQDVSGSVFESTTKSIDIPVECGWYYRWRVRAIDGNGNLGDWSGWFEFAVTLS